LLYENWLTKNEFQEKKVKNYLMNKYLKYQDHTMNYYFYTHADIKYSKVFMILVQLHEKKYMKNGIQSQNHV